MRKINICCVLDRAVELLNKGAAETADAIFEEFKHCLEIDLVDQALFTKQSVKAVIDALDAIKTTKALQGHPQILQSLIELAKGFVDDRHKFNYLMWCTNAKGKTISDEMWLPFVERMKEKQLIDLDKDEGYEVDLVEYLNFVNEVLFDAQPVIEEAPEEQSDEDEDEDGAEPESEGEQMAEMQDMSAEAREARAPPPRQSRLRQITNRLAQTD
eukprot:SAG11_NODE_31_length_23119_cov_102.800608_7_plen_214_part_00